MSKCVLTHDRLKELLDYDSYTGLFTWIQDRSNRVLSGTMAGCINSYGYIAIRLLGSSYLAHRLAWFYIYGVWPAKHLDHINGERDDNRLANLREASDAEQQQNVKLTAANTSGHKGVSWNRRHKKWIAQIKAGGRYLYLGAFTEIEDAVAARAEGKRKYHTFNPQDRST